MLQIAERRKNVVLAHGCFDLLHLGHIRHLQEAKDLGDYLIVSITSDKYVKKQNWRPQFSVEQRREALMALDCVDEVIISESDNAVSVIERIKPAIYVKGVDYSTYSDNNLILELAAVVAVGGKFHTTIAEKWSSTELLRNVRLPDETFVYLETARKRNFLDQICQAIEAADKLKIAFIGETIIDEYRYVRSLAKPAKEHILATVATSTEKFEGGVLAAAKHNEWKDVRVVTSSSTITKTRFVNEEVSRKLFEVYSAQHLTLTAPQRAALHKDICQAVHGSDVVIVYDFGHGLLNYAERFVFPFAKFLAVTAQTNAGNCGFNPVTKYGKASYVCVDEPEARLAAQQATGPIEHAVNTISRETGAEYVTVTRGRHGSVTSKGGPDAIYVPAFVEGGFDTMGAGDAFFAVAAPLLATGLDVEQAAFAGNVAGGLKTCILGHRHHVGRADLIKNMEWLLK